MVDDAGGGRDAGRLDLRRHAAGADLRAAAADLDVDEVLRAADDRDPLRPGPARRSVVEGVDVGEEHERVGVDEVGDEGGEPVVVAEADLARGDGVVLVDDGQHAEVEQPLEGAAGVGVVRAPGDVVGGEQHLTDGDVVPGERLGVGGEQGALADRGRGLLGREVAGAGGSGRAGGCRPRWRRS